MPYSRPRHLSGLIKKSLNFSPIVGVLGHRQVGKTTLCETLAGDYITMDQAETLSRGLHSPDALLQAHAASPLVIDECQWAPPLFPALKEWVRTHKKPGQFLLTGSVRFSSRKAIRESLTGRIINWELLPMDLSEAHSMPLPRAIPLLLQSKNLDCHLKPAPYYSTQAYDQALLQGGLPGVFSVRDPVVRKQRFETQIETLLERDLRLLVQTTLEYRVLRNLLAVLASRQGLPLELAAIARSARISVPALRRLIGALEAMFVLRVIETQGSRHKPILFFEDQGEATHLKGPTLDLLLRITFFMFSNLRQQWTYRPDLEAVAFQYRNRGGAFVPLAIKSRIGVLGLIPMLDEAPGKHELASAQSFLEQNSGAKCLFVHLGNRDSVLARNLRVVPLACLV